MTSTSTTTPPTPPTPSAPTLRLNSQGGATIILMTSLIEGVVVYSADVSLPVGLYKANWSGTVNYVGSVTLNQGY